MRNPPSAIESTHRSTAYRARPLDPAVSFMPGLSRLRQQLQLSAVATELRRALDWVGDAHTIRLSRDEQARTLWHDRYPVLSQARPDLYGAATGRAEAQVLRLSAIYAVLDCSSSIRLPHLQAALAVWDYCSASASLLFGPSTGDHTADRILEAINASTHGLSRTQMNEEESHDLSTTEETANEESMQEQT